jgi:hypothetical protein
MHKFFIYINLNRILSNSASYKLPEDDVHRSKHVGAAFLTNESCPKSALIGLLHMCYENGRYKD